MKIRQSVSYGRRYTKVNWQNYTAVLSRLDVEDILQDGNSLDQAAELTLHNLTTALDAVAPKKVRTIEQKSAWWTKALERQRTQLKSLYLKFRNNPNARDKYLRLRKEYAKCPYAVAQSVASSLPKTEKVGTWIESREGKEI